MPKATWNGTTIAEAGSNEVQIVENNIYFPPSAVDKSYLRPSATNTVCGWKGTASYYDLVVDGSVNKDAAWYYPTPKSAAENISGYIAFWKGVEISK